MALWRSLVLGAMTLALTACATAAPSPAPPQVVRILFGGDTGHGESYHESYPAVGEADIIAERGYDYSLRGLAPILERADYTILNLETPLTLRKSSPLTGKDYLHWSHPDKSTERLAAYGVDAVSLANNHTLDYGLPGLEDTFDALRRYGVSWFGAGNDAAEAAAPLIRTVRVGGRDAVIAVIGSFERRPSYVGYRFYAEGETGGANVLSPEAVARQVAELRQAYPGVFVVAFPHWGSNYSWRSEQQARLGRALIDAGADMVIGHHGHALQEIERYRDKWILYGIGNFMFNSRGRFPQYPDIVPFGLAVELVYEDRPGPLTPHARLYPIFSDNRRTNYQPRFATDPEADRAFGTLLERSRLGPAAALVQFDRDEIARYLQLPLTPGPPAAPPR